ncbi:hypothetical protein [Aliivibrio kagoshimensis]|uniref:hypothetical protein n=1 Tax=Aliivibrio kagoshimensis TaxID=2910230 RepID=UPI003D140097
MLVRPIKLLSPCILGASLLCSNSVLAENFSYNFIEARIGGSPSTFGGQMSGYITENSHFIAKMDSEFSGDWDLAVGAGFNGPLNEFSDLTGQLLLHNVKSSGSDKVGDENMTELNVGLRAWILPQMEVGGSIGQLIDSDESQTIGSAHFRFHSTDQLSVGAAMKFHGVYGSQVIMTARFLY